MKRFQQIYSIFFSLCLLAFTAYALMDTFVITRVYATVEENGAEVRTETGTDSTARRLSSKRPGGRGRNRSATEENAENTENTEIRIVSPDADAVSGEKQIQISEYRVNDTTVYVADVQLSSAAQLRTAFSRNSYGRNVTADTSDTAEAVGAVLAINGDNYGSREKGYVIRNGVLYRDTPAKDQEDLVIYADGSFAIISETEVTAQELLDSGAVQVFSFGPGLVENGTVSVDAGDEVDRAKASNPRTAVGIIEENHYVFVVSDGRTEESEGLTLCELAEFMQSLGVQTAYNLDGGGSSTMVYQGAVVNRPTSGHGIDERAVTDILFI